MAKLNLTVYKIRETISGVPVTGCSDILKDSSSVSEYTFQNDIGFDGKLFVIQNPPKRPSWSGFLEDGVGDISELIQQRTTSALLVIQTQIGNEPHFFAMTFGSGARFLMKTGAHEPDFGLKIALNTIYAEGEDGADHSRIRSVNAKTIAGDVFNSTIQASRRTNFEAFELDTSGDQLRSITGQPLDEQLWGTRITGGPAVNTQYSGAISGLEALCHRLQAAYSGNAYEQDFGWVDNIRAVQETTLRESLNESLIENIVDGADNLEIVPIRILAWEYVDQFRITGMQGGPIELSDPEGLMELFIERLTATNRLDNLALPRLKSYRLEIIDGNGDLMENTALYGCIEGEISFDGQTYLISEGDFFKINESYLDQLNDYVDALQPYGGDLPTSTVSETEGVYNERAANSSDQFLMLDRATVRVPGKTTPIEVCDILTRGGDFIHAKRKLGSSALSHLFAQGAVSADLFLMSPEYRLETRTKIDEQVALRVEEHPDFVGDFMPFETNSITPPDFEVVYAIIAKWNGRSNSQAIPFFSKVNLRRICHDLQRMGFRFSICAVEALPDDD